jgi:hypothetical protein
MAAFRRIASAGPLLVAQGDSDGVQAPPILNLTRAYVAPMHGVHAVEPRDASAARPFRERPASVDRDASLPRTVEVPRFHGAIALVVAGPPSRALYATARQPPRRSFSPVVARGRVRCRPRRADHAPRKGRSLAPSRAHDLVLVADGSWTRRSGGGKRRGRDRRSVSARRRAWTRGRLGLGLW